MARHIPVACGWFCSLIDRSIDRAIYLCVSKFCRQFFDKKKINIKRQDVKKKSRRRGRRNSIISSETTSTSTYLPAIIAALVLVQLIINNMIPLSIVYHYLRGIVLYIMCGAQRVDQYYYYYQLVLITYCSPASIRMYITFTFRQNCTIV